MRDYFNKKTIGGILALAALVLVAQSISVSAHNLRGDNAKSIKMGNRDVHHEIILDSFGLDKEDVQAQLESGSTMKEILEEAGITKEDFRSATEEAREAKMAKLLEDGVITQEQFDARLERLENFQSGDFNFKKSRFKGHHFGL